MNDIERAVMRLDDGEAKEELHRLLVRKGCIDDLEAKFRGANAWSVIRTVVRDLRRGGFGDLVDDYVERAKSGDHDNLIRESMRFYEG